MNFLAHEINVENTASEVWVFLAWSFPRTGTRQGPGSGSSNLISCALERSLIPQSVFIKRLITESWSSPCQNSVLVENTSLVMYDSFFSATGKRVRVTMKCTWNLESHDPGLEIHLPKLSWLVYLKHQETEQKTLMSS